jgi:pilus assembly protein CpaE
MAGVMTEQHMGTENVVCGLKVVNEATGKDLDGFISSLPGFTVEKNASAGQWDLLVIETNGNADREISFAREALASQMTKNIFFTSSQMDPKVLLEALRIGAKGFFRQPIDFNEVRETLMRIREEKKALHGDEEPALKGKIVSVIGSKGGAGTSIVAANVAMSLASLEGADAAVFVDVNEVFGDAPLLFNIEHPVDWVEISKNISRLDATYLMTILFKHESGLYVLPGPAAPAEQEEMGRVMESLLRLMQGLFQYIIVDGGRRLDQLSRSILKLSDRVLVVTQLTLSGIINASRLQKLFQESGRPAADAVDIVVNRFTKRDAAFLKEAEKLLNRRIEWCIPNDYRTAMAAIDESKSLMSVDRKAEISLRMLDLAMAIAGRDEKRPARSRFLGLI